MKKFIITEEQLKMIEKVIQPLNFLNQPIPSSLGMNIVQILNQVIPFEDEIKEMKGATE